MNANKLYYTIGDAVLKETGCQDIFNDHPITVSELVRVNEAVQCALVKCLREVCTDDVPTVNS